ncbi:helicase SWR1-like [Vicia villosa]|uniref:helicase SWR1-like n=1 Tax=Vicia villosa TaxID=3911 RepID=UPI00273C4F4A|nr:helicase SWR1-like [Vicia villosa]
MDEARALKDKNSFRWKNLMSVARNANQRLMLTGTPLQNDLHMEAPGHESKFATLATQRNKKICDGLVDFSALQATCGRPLGLGFNHQTGDLYVADAYFGLDSFRVGLLCPRFLNMILSMG